MPLRRPGAFAMLLSAMWRALLGLVVMTALILGWRSLLVPGGAVRPHVALRDGVAVLRPPRGRNAMFAGLALAPTMLLLAVLRWVGRSEREDQVGLALAALLVALGAWLVVWLLAAEFRQHIRVDASSIERVFAITRLRVRWSEVERIVWNPRARWFFIVAAGAWLWVPIDFDGISDFAAMALDGLPPTVLLGAVDARQELEVLVQAPVAGTGRPG
jgi:hypothetical protein